MIKKSTIKPIKVKIQEKRKQIAAQTKIIRELIQVQNQNKKELEMLLEEERMQKRSLRRTNNNQK